MLLTTYQVRHKQRSSASKSDMEEGIIIGMSPFIFICGGVPGRPLLLLIIGD